MQQQVLRRASTPLLALAALGIVYGDIGTSPLYAFKEAFAPGHGLAVSTSNVLAALSMLFWSVTAIVSIKYVGLVLRFDNGGEGGVLALTALAQRLARRAGRTAAPLVAGGIFAAALFYGDAIITPAISVLSALEGLAVSVPASADYVLPTALVILTLLFALQRHGTGRVGRLFGPITVIWFLALGGLGVVSIAQTPLVLGALNPVHAAAFALEHPVAAFVLLSAVFLALTGGEALYADMGHFGARPIRLAWYGLVWPCLMLNYFGQGALLVRDPTAVANPFYLLAPGWARLGLVLLATAATVIASQATITGAYSLTLQASRLGYLPRLRVLHTSDTERGQIYVPAVNWLMFVAVVWLVLEFRSSGGLAAAYGIAVSGTMIVTTLLALFIVRLRKSRRRLPLSALFGGFAVLEMLFLASNMTKLADGGWLPLVIGLGLFLVLTTWKLGSGELAEQRRRDDLPLADFLAGPAPDVPRVPGTAIYLTSDPTLVPSALFHNLKHFKVMHERTVFLHVVGEDLPRVDDAQRVEIRVLGPATYAVTVRYGFREEPDLPHALHGASRSGFVLDVDPMLTTWFVARSTVIDGPGGLPRWRCALFAWMSRQSESAATWFGLPPNRVVEMGTQVLL